MNPCFLCTWPVLFFHLYNIYVITKISRATRLRACASSNNRTEISSSSFSHEGAANPYPRKRDGGPVVREQFLARIWFCFLFFAIPPKFNRAIPVHNNTRTRGFQYDGVFLLWLLFFVYKRVRRSGALQHYRLYTQYTGGDFFTAATFK